MTTQPASRRREILAGLTTFLTMSYIVIVNPAVLAVPGTGLAFGGVLTATVLVSFSATLLMGLYAKIPYAVAPGMGLNAFFTYSIVLGQGVPWRTALGIVFWSGLLFLVVSVTPLRVVIARAIPGHLRCGIAVGIGLFLAFLGLRNLGLVVAHPVTMVGFGHVTPRVLVALFGMAGMAVLLRKKSPFAFLAGIFGITAVFALAGWLKVPERLVSMPDFSSTFLRLDVVSSLRLAYLPAMMGILLTDLFDSLATFMGLAQASGLRDEHGEPRGLSRGLAVDAYATFAAGLFGSSAGTAYIESAAGIEVGGRTGLTSVVTALCFLPCLFLAPLAGMVPSEATAPVLILVGALMFRTASEVSWNRVGLEEALPAFLAAILIPLTFSITHGVLWGFLSHVALYSLAGRRREVSPAMWALGVVAAGLLVLESRG